MGIHYLLNQIAQAPVIKNPGLPTVSADNTTITTVFLIVLNIVGAVSLVIITIAGFKYVISRGEPQAIAKAKDTILYALIGLGVAIMGRVIVAFVFNRVGT